MKHYSLIFALICLIFISCKQESPTTAIQNDYKLNYSVKASSGGFSFKADKILGIWIEPHSTNNIWNATNLHLLKDYYGFQKIMISDMPGERL